MNESLNKFSEIRAQFPILKQKVHGKPVAFLDSGASAQKPQCVIDAELACYSEYYANIHRGVYQFSEQSTQAFESARLTVQQFLNAKSNQEIIFTKGTTESINLVAGSFGRMMLKQKDIVVLSEMEHHANIVPWQMICQEVGAEIKVIPFNEIGELCYETYEKILKDYAGQVKMVALTQTSNVLGTINDVKRLVEAAHNAGAKILIDGAQGVVDAPLNVVEMDVDFYVFSAHKLYGPSGVGVLYGKKTLLEKMPPYQTGGDMIDIVSFEGTTFAPLPNKFEAGTPNIAGVIGSAVAIQWLQNIGIASVADYKKQLLAYATNQLSTLPQVTIYGHAKEKAAILAFNVDGIHPHDIGTLLDHEGVAIRVGHHCAQPLMRALNVPATVRASMGVYSNQDDIDRLIEGLKKTIQMFA